MHTSTLPRLSSHSLLTHDPAQPGPQTEATFRFSSATSFRRGEKPVTPSCEAAPRPQKRRFRETGSGPGRKEAGLPKSGSRSDGQRPGGRWSGPRHAAGLSASPTRERSRPEKAGDFLVSFLHPSFLGVESGNRAPVPEARPSPVPPLGAPRSRSAPPRQQPPGNARLLPAPPPPLPGWWSGPRPHGAAGPPRPPAAAEAAATCFGRQPPPRCSTPRSGTHAPCAHTSPLRSERPGQSS